MLVYTLGVVTIAVASYWLEKQRYMADIDARLLAAASNIPEILPADFHDIAHTPGAISEAQDQYNLELMSRHARSGDLTYLYSYVMHEGMIYFTSCNYTEADIANNRVVTYWTSYPEGSPEYFDAMTATEPVYVTAGDRWGLFRTILIPMKSPGGQPYVAAADMDITVIQQSLLRSVLSIIGVSLLLLLLATPLVLAYRHTYSEMNGELRKLNQQLQAKLDQAKILESELIDATQKANAANTTKSQFLANMSHELRTPINGVMGMNELLLDTNLSIEQREYAIQGNQSARVLLDTVNQILDLSTIEAGGLVPRIEPLAAARFFDEIAQMFASQIAEKKLDLVMRLDTSIPSEIETDALRLRQVLINLIANAIKFTNHGGIQVSLSWHEGVLSGQVCDSGIGIPEEAQQRIFETFQQVDNSSTRRYGGTGLGLPISRQICRAMGGDLQLNASSQQGSTFVFQVDAPATVPAPIQLGSTRPDKHTLVFSESPLLGNWLVSELTRESAHCQLATTLDEALATAVHCDLLLVDASVGISKLCALTTIMDTTKQSLVWLAWSGQHLSETLATQVKVLHKPFTSHSLTAALSQADSVTPPVRPVRFSGRVLLVDDNPSNLIALGSQLRQTGLTVDQVENGAEAIRYCQSHPYDLVLMDIQMPRMDGLEATRRIRELLADKAPPIVGISAHVMDDDIASARASGMTDYLCKPVTKITLLNKVGEFLTS